MTITKNKSLSKAKKSLADMMDTLRPFMPSTDVPPPPENHGWALPDAVSPRCDENKSRAPVDSAKNR
jgi:hypothetical protein